MTTVLGPLKGNTGPWSEGMEPAATLLFILAATEFVSLYYTGSRRTARDRGTAAFHGFLTRYFRRFNADVRDPRGRLRRIRVPLLRSGGKATQRMRIPAALIHLYGRGVLHDLVAEDAREERCVRLSGRWGFQINVHRLHEDFQEALLRYEEEVLGDPALADRFLRRFRYLHGWTHP